MTPTEKEIEEAAKLHEKKWKQSPFCSNRFYHGLVSQAFSEGANWAIEKEKERVKGLVEALEDMLKNVSLDWYMQQFGKDTSPQPPTTGIAAKIHNQETMDRVLVAFANARDALKEYRGED